MIGSPEQLGSWDPHKSPIKLEWSEGHYWNVKCKQDDIPSNFEFKFVIMKKGEIIRWEEGQNHLYRGLSGGIANLTCDDSAVIAYYDEEKK